ncbi:arsenate reductase ArsC [Paraglaciecola sp. MB-3u-78]|uniref:arsenate reductase ArsC n=1 Tax=Paraglaciecola sp. MB-3u-78 TaxID=2058332 RepID=UPI000C32567B|nr:arsenate reductase ArsC [Paraglaciecola sp. MB-3u-78]PKG93245.1 low molecular weight phosphatase family protein [Paraglaciecola sp. MB-3u-78]
MKILYICTHNRCRSILSEAITNQFSVGKAGKIVAKSAGSQPVGEVHPLSIQYLQEAGISTDGLCSQSWDDFEQFAPDLVVTVCDSAAGETCPAWFGKSLKVHWGLADPSKLQGSEAQIAEAFRATIEQIKQRVEQLVNLDVDVKDKVAFKAALANLGAV